jgi:hypothetical protein
MGQSGAEGLEGARVETYTLPRQGFSGQAGKIAGIILITRYYAASLVVFTDLDERAVVADGVRLDQEKGLGIEGPREVTFQGVGRRAISPTARKPQAHQAPSAHHRNGRQLPLKPRRIGQDITFGQVRGVKRVIRIRRDRVGKERGALAYKAQISAVNDGGPKTRAWLRDEALDIGTTA